MTTSDAAPAGPAGRTVPARNTVPASRVVPGAAGTPAVVPGAAGTPAVVPGAAGTPAVVPATVAAGWCDRCGEPAGAGDHAPCGVARALEPPRFCAHCRRRMKVQVLPVGWSAICVEHGETRG